MAYDAKTRYPMPPQVEGELPSTAPWQSTLAELNGLWLCIECGCGHTAYHPFRLMAAQLGWKVRLESVVPKLRCSACTSRPGTVALVDNASHQGGRRVGLVP